MFVSWLLLERLARILFVLRGMVRVRVRVTFQWFHCFHGDSDFSLASYACPHFEFTAKMKT